MCIFSSASSLVPFEHFGFVLPTANGEYASMWETQSKASQDVAYDETKEGL